MVKLKTASSVASSERGFTVSASPFNPLKLELGIILVLGCMVLLLQERLITEAWLQFLVLLGYGCLSALWLIWRTRRLLHRLLGSHDGA